MDSTGIMSLGGVECRYMLPAALKMQKSLRYVDTFGILPLLNSLCFDPVTKRWDPPNILLSGPSGVGKTLLTACFASMSDIPYLEINCSEETRERHLRGGFVVRGGDTPFVLGTASNAIQVANEVGTAMLVLDELPTLSPLVQKSLNSLTDFRRRVELPELAANLEVREGAQLVVIATSNQSSRSFDLNSDLKSRFIELEIPYPSPDAEKTILREIVPVSDEHALHVLVSVANETRQGQTYPISTRDLVELLTALPRVGWADTLFLLTQKFPPEDRNFIITRIQDHTHISPPSNLRTRAGST